METQIKTEESVKKDTLPSNPNQPPEAPVQPYYVGTMPAETPPQQPGKTEGIIAIVCAVVALLFVPPLFGIIGILLGVKSKQKGQKTLGNVAIILAAVFMVVGIVLGYFASTYNAKAAGI